MKSWADVLSKSLPPAAQRVGSGTGHDVPTASNEDYKSWKFVKQELGSSHLTRWSDGLELLGPRTRRGTLICTPGIARALVRKGASWCLCVDIKGLRDL